MDIAKSIMAENKSVFNSEDKVIDLSEDEKLRKVGCQKSII